MIIIIHFPTFAGGSKASSYGHRGDARRRQTDEGGKHAELE
jgi:hypothetical protein